MTPRILAVDTTSSFGSIALLEGDQIVEEAPLHSTEGFGHILFAQIGALLRRHGVPKSGIDCFAAAAGPGSFTGVRVGLTAVKGLAAALHKPAVGVSNLAALATFGTGRLRATMLDARRGEIFAALYNDSLELVSAEVVARLRTWLETLPEGDVEIISGELAQLRDALVEAQLTHIPVIQPPRALAGAVGQIAAERFRLGLADDPAALDANYVRRSDANMLWTDNVGFTPGRRE